MTTTKRKGQDMTHDDTRDNTTAIEATIITADARETDPRPFRQPEERHEEHNDGANGYDPEDPEHDPIGDAETEYDDEPEDDGQPSEYTEWQDYMGGDEHYDHSANEMW